MRNVRSTPEYVAIAAFYEGQFAKRSGIPYLNHIDEGLIILDEIGASETAKRAFCLHPLAQGDAELAIFNPSAASTRDVLVAVMEYRNVANRYLSFHHDQPFREPRLSPLADVNDMLIADKVQNRKDFENHPALPVNKRIRLAAYFEKWLFALGVSDDRFVELSNLIEGD
jgi:hypothetical protein